jgi:hypothetical protein
MRLIGVYLLGCAKNLLDEGHDFSRAALSMRLERASAPRYGFLVIRGEFLCDHQYLGAAKDADFVRHAPKTYLRG